MIEIMGYTASLDLFTLIVVIIEMPRAGGVYASGHVQSLNFHSYRMRPEYLSFMMDLLLAAVIVIYSVYIFRKLWKLGVIVYVHSFWNVLDVLLIFLAWAMVVVDLSYSVILQYTVQTYHANRVVRFQYLITMFLWRASFSGLTTFIMMLRCFQFLEMFSLLNRFLIVLEHIARLVVTIVLLLVLQFYIIATFMYLMAGDRHSEFLNMEESVLNVLLGIHIVVSNVFHEGDKLSFSEFDVTIFFFLFFLIIVNFITMSFTFAIVYSTFVEFFPKHPEINRMSELVKEYFEKTWKIGGKGKKETPKVEN